MRVVSEQKCFDGVMGFYAHPSKECGVEMGFAIFRPPQAATRARGATRIRPEAILATGRFRTCIGFGYSWWAWSSA